MRATPPRNDIERVAGDALLQGVMQFPNEARRLINRSLRGAFITANVFYRRETFAEIGGFDEWFATEAEDIDFFWRILGRYPGRLLYEPTLAIYHSFPTTWSGLFYKWYHYGIASCKLQKRHLGTFHLDISHYQRLMRALWNLLIIKDRRIENLARIVQLSGHLIGKYHGSLRFGIVNL
jgi:GT2 family glycosyltransferase